MTSQELIKSWDSSKTVFGSKGGTFFALHRICAAGAEGVSMAALNRVSASPSRPTFHRWKVAGLITLKKGRSVTGRHTITYHATAKAYQLLRVEAPQPTEH